jgi:hypothetical protein
VVVAAVSEAEHAAVFANGQVGSDERTILPSPGRLPPIPHRHPC